MKSPIPNYVRLDFLEARRKRADWTDDDAREIWQSVQWAFSQGNHEDRANCEIWLKLEAGKIRKAETV